MGNIFNRQRRANNRPIPQQDYAFATSQEPVVLQATGVDMSQIPPPQPMILPAAGGPVPPLMGNDPFMANRGMVPRLPNLSNMNLPNRPGQMIHQSDLLLSNLTGWSLQDVERLRHEFNLYTNTGGAIDREGFRKLFAASLLNTSWDVVEREAEIAFRSFDTNQSGTLDFVEYMSACVRMVREASSPPY